MSLKVSKFCIPGIKFTDMKILIPFVWRAILILGMLLQTFQLCSQTHLSQLADVPAPFLTVPQTVVEDELGRPYYYLAAKSGGLQVFDIQSITNPTLVKTVSKTDLDGLEVMDAFQQGNFLYLALGNFFGSSNTQTPGLGILDISDPANPVVKDVWRDTTEMNGSGFVTVQGDYAYLGGMLVGFYILNVHIPDSIKLVSKTQPDQNFPVQNPSGPAVPRGRGMAIRNDLLYLCYDAGGLRIMDISDKSHPQEIGHYINPGNPNKQQAFNNIALNGDLAYIAVDYCGMEVLNIANPANITRTGWWNPWSCESPSNLWVGSPGHSNQIIFDFASQLVFLSTGQSELSIVDVSDPAQPQLFDGYGATDDQIGTWGVTFRGNRIYLTYILAAIPFSSNWAGVKIFDWNYSTGTIRPKIKSEISVSPNPFSDHLTVQLLENIPVNLTVTLFDALGRKVSNLERIENDPGNQSFEWAGRISPGIYFLQVTEGQNSRMVKLFNVGN